MSMKKEYLKDKPVCRVTFFLLPHTVANAPSVAVAGDFNGWNQTAHIMKKGKDGTFTLTIDLPINKEYQFKYVAHGNWYNKEDADAYAYSSFSNCDNSVIDA